MKKVKFKWSFNEASAIMSVIHRLVNETKQVTHAEMLVRVVLIKLIIKMRTALMFKFLKSKTFSIEIDQAIAIYCIAAPKKLDYYSSYEAACILPVIEEIEKTIIKARYEQVRI